MEAVHLKPTPLLASLYRISELQKEISDADSLLAFVSQLKSGGTTTQLLNLTDAQRRTDDAVNVIKNVHVRRAVRDGSKRLTAEESSLSANITLEERSAFVSILLQDVEGRESLHRASIAQEQTQFQQFASVNEPVWRMGAAQQTDARRKRERERRLAEITHALVNMEEDARQDKHQWFQEARDWFAAVKFTEEDERHSVIRRIRRNNDDAAIAAALQASAMGPSRPQSYQSTPPSQPAFGAPYGMATNTNRPSSNAPPSAYPQYNSYGFGSTTAAPSKGPAGYPAYGAASTPYNNGPTNNQQQFYDPFRTNPQQAPQQSNNYGMAQQSAFGGPPPSTRPPAAANQYTAPPASIFYGRY